MRNATQSFEEVLAVLARDHGDARAPAPVEAWRPVLCGDIDIRIARDGTWFHEGARITREPLVRLFASILRKDEDGHTYLVTPAEMLRITVEDAHFTVVRADRAGEGEAQAIVFTTNVGDRIALGPDHPLRVTADATGAPRPYVHVRGRLEARILRAPFYELVDWSQVRGQEHGVWSDGAFFTIGPAHEL